jgi:acetylserotonin N-methyltransferase
MVSPSPVVELIEAFKRSKVMFVAESLGVFDRLSHGASASADKLAGELKANVTALQTLLDTCTGMQLLRKENGVYTNAAVANEYLSRRSPYSLAGYIRFSERAMYSLWGNLESAVRDGSNRWEQTFGDRAALFSNFFKTEELKRDFLAGMHGYGVLSSDSVVAAHDLSRFRRLVDLGGATGHLSVAACVRYPRLHAVVFDLPEVIPITQEYLAKSPVSDRVETIAGDFFSDHLPDGDLYSLGRILHDWSEPRIIALLTKIYDQLPLGGALLIGEKLLDEDKTGPLPAQLKSLDMLVCTEGKERTLQEYAALLDNTGFKQVQGKRTGTPVDAIIAFKG